MIARTLYNLLEKRMFSGKAIILLGPRQVGKTTLILELLKNRPFLFLNGDDSTTRDLLVQANTFTLQQLIGKNTIVFLDEAQRIPGIGITLKIITDQFKDVQLIVSGSSVLEINQQLQEPLTGRKWEYHLFPISFEELENHVGFLAAEQQLEWRLIYGMYPDVINNPAEAYQILQQLAESYLYKDVLALTGIRKPEILYNLLKALALQMGAEVSYNELSNLIGIDKMTVMRYIDILEKAFIIFQLHSFSRNQRNEIKKNRKVYFYDNGIRNMIIANLNPIDLRNDKGALWENFLISERMKSQLNHEVYANRYFWRTIQKQEIDYVEDKNGIISAFEFKWKDTKKNRIPQSFLENYQAIGTIVHRDNFRSFIFKS